MAIQYLAKIALAEGKLDEAEEYIEKAQELAPKNAKIQFDAARVMGAQAQDASIFSASGYASKFLEAFKKAVELKPNFVKQQTSIRRYCLFAKYKSLRFWQISTN